MIRWRPSQEVVVLVTYTTALYMSVVDNTIIYTALPSLARDFHQPLSAAQWVTLSYVLTLAVMIPSSGWIGDQFGTRRTFLTALALFTAASAACGLSGSLAQLVIFRVLQGVGGGLIVPVNPPAIPGIGITAGFQMWIEQKGSGDYQQLSAVVEKIIAKAKTRPELAGVSTTIRTNGRQMLADVDREKSETLGVPVQDSYSTLQTMFGSLYVSQFPKDSRLYQVVLQAEPKYRMTPEDIGRFYVRNRNAEMIPLSALVTTRYVTGPDLVTRFNNYPAIAINGAPAPGVSSGAALAAIREVAEELIPSGYGYEWAGEAREEISSGSTSAVAFVFGLLFVFMILAAQYESWALPVGVMMAVPFAIMGSLVAIALRHIPNDLYFQIGMLTLIGLAAKNAILIVEFAVELNRKENMSFFDAAAEAARLRLRPIVMTSFAFVLGTVPLAIATGASANSRHSIGTGVIGGTLASTIIAIFFTPMFFWLLETVSHRFFGGANRKTPEHSEHGKPTEPASGLVPADAPATSHPPGGN